MHFPMKFLGLVVLTFCYAVNAVPRPTCPKFPSCTWAQEIDAKLCSGIDEENVCPGAQPLCVNSINAPSRSANNANSTCCCLTPNPELKHLEKGELNPPMKEGKLRLYFMRFCPYCHRVALVSFAKKIATDIVYVNLRKNPEWFTGNSKLGRFVPLVETERGQFNGSLIVSDFLDEAYPMPGELYPRNKILKAIDRVFIENFNTLTPPVFSRALKNSTFIPMFEEHVTLLGNELEKRGTSYFAGNDKPGMVDYMIWPWMERKPVLQILFPTAFNYNETDPRIATWTKLMKKDTGVASYGLAPEAHYEFIRSVQETEDKDPNYNVLVQ